MSQINSKYTETELASALIELTKECEFKDISISAVAFKANMHRNTVYYHFKNMKELCLFAIHSELIKTKEANEHVEDTVVFFFSRFKRLLDFTCREIGIDEFLPHMRTEILPLVEPLVTGEHVNSDEKKRTAVDIFVQQILVAYLLYEHPGNHLRMIFENIMPEILSHGYL